ncbi:uncharacterized protein Non2 [Euwallacea similis]|uniref:uncharacterized protein Non2 n=1 Tax=Euwallacea similis TaxID=1736056 RepID=UPI00344F8F30
MADISKQSLRKEIAAILKDADLASTSAKKVRQELEEKLDVKLAGRKKEIDDLVMEFVSSKKDKPDKKKKKDDSEEEVEENEEEEEEEEEEDEDSDSEKKNKRASTGKKPAAKKAKKSSDDSASEGSEGESEEEYSPKKAKPAKTRKLPPKKKKGSESDSDEDWGKKKGGKKGGGKRGGGGGYTKQMQLSPELASLVGADTMARHEVVKKVWSIIKEKNLYDPKNKQYAICDDALMKVIGTKRFRTFGMMKYLKNHFIS